MNPAPDHPDQPQRHRIAVVLVIAAVAILCAVIYWAFNRRGNVVATEPVVSGFYTGLAALDVEENELAAQMLRTAVEREPREPALWANLAVAQMRLRDMESAHASLRQALALAGDRRELRLLRAEVLEHAGDIEAAIQQLRQVHQSWPENISATFSLVRLLGQIRSGEAEAERLTLLEEILARTPGNRRALCEYARLAATLQRGDELRTALDRLLSESDAWPKAAAEQLAEADQAARTGDFQHAARSLTFFENLLKPTAQYQESLAQLGISSAGTIGTPLREFLRLQLPAVEAADADIQLRFELEPISEAETRPDLVLAMEQYHKPSATVVAFSADVVHAGESVELPFPGSSLEASATSLSAADLNFDFQQDLILTGTEGCRVFLGQKNGSFTAEPVAAESFDRSWRSVWAVDVEADGDLDLLLSDHQSPLHWVRNNGDMTFAAASQLIPAESVRDLKAADLDGDGDVDLVTLSASEAVSVWENLRSGQYAAARAPAGDPQMAIAIGDVDRDGRFDIVTLSAAGTLRIASWKGDGTWAETNIAGESVANWPKDTVVGDAFLTVADIDNNGGVDIIGSTGYTTQIWLRSASGGWTQLRETPAMRVTSAADVNGDGRRDLVGLTETAAVVALNQSRAGYGWHVIQPTANTAAGDKRINPFGIGGRIEVRAGNLVQAAVIDSPRVHFGLGRHKQADVARILWPNGTMQAEFELQAGETLAANQRLKGSCPWVFTYDGREFRFIKDFIWRSPLGLRINAQTTAGVLQTEDWIKIAGDQLAETNGRYLVRITAELWETHFFDHVRLLAVDHPAEVEVFVDERFVPNQMPALQVIAATRPQPLQNLVNHRGDSLDGVLNTIDGTYADGFELGEFQGVAEEHWVEFTFPDEVAADRRVLIIGQGWVYPTDSSLNVALSQGAAARPFGLMLEQQNAEGAWQVVHDNLGFPSGKNKDVVLEVPAGALAVSRKFRLRTNMEIYWDALGWSYAVPEVEPRLTELATDLAELRYRGYSSLLPLDRKRPDTPVYEVESTEQRWLDLEGYYTRFGDVRELLAGVDDRYVIMNAGDELVFEFAAAADLPKNWRRDFVLVGDGWVKDGDFNTAFSKWVRPLPTHANHEYSGPLAPLHGDPVYRRYPEDWRTYHTRYVTPHRFQQGLWRTSPPHTRELRP